MLATLQVCSAGVGGMLLSMHVAAGHFDPLELRSSPSTSCRKEPNTLGHLLKTILVVMPMWQQLDTVIKMLNHRFSAARPLFWELTAGIHLPICDQQQQEGDTAGISESKPLSSYPQQGAGVLAQSSPAVVFIIGNVHERRCPESFLKISFPHSL